MGQFKPMVKMMTTEPSVVLKLKKGGHVSMKHGGKSDGHKMMNGGVMAGLSKSKSDVFDTAAVQEFEQELVGLIERMMAGGFGFAQPPAEF